MRKLFLKRERGDESDSNPDFLPGATDHQPPPLVKLQLLCPWQSGEVIQALSAPCSIWGREETPRRTPGCLRVSRRGKAQGRADSKDHIYYSFTAWISAQAWQEGTKTFHYKNLRQQNRKTPQWMHLHLCSAYNLQALSWSAGHLGRGLLLCDRQPPYSCPRWQFHITLRRMKPQTEAYVFCSSRTHGSSARRHYALNNRKESCPASCVFTRLSTTGATNALFKTFVQKKLLWSLDEENNHRSE